MILLKTAKKKILSLYLSSFLFFFHFKLSIWYILFLLFFWLYISLYYFFLLKKIFNKNIFERRECSREYMKENPFINSLCYFPFPNIKIIFTCFPDWLKNILSPAFNHSIICYYHLFILHKTLSAQNLSQIFLTIWTIFATNVIISKAKCFILQNVKCKIFLTTSNFKGE